MSHKKISEQPKGSLRRSPRSGARAFFVGLAVCGGLLFLGTKAQAWETQYVGTGQFDAYTSIAVDADENAHISYYDDANQDLKYATNATGAWVPETIADTGKQGLHTSIALDSSGKVHISYAEQTSFTQIFALRYATKNASGAWVIEEVDTVTVTYTSIAIDSSDKVHIVYSCILCGVTNTSIELKYATNATGAWVNETIFPLITSVSGDASIAMDSLDNAHISFQDNGKIRYATNATGNWVMEDVDTTGSSFGNRYTSIALDLADKAHISYHNSDNENIKYATNATGAWVVEIAASSPRFPSTTSIALDPSGKAHISYVIFATSGLVSDLGYVTNVTGEWQSQIVDGNGIRAVGSYNSIAIGPSGRAHISYCDCSAAGAGRIKVARSSLFEVGAEGGPILIDSIDSRDISIATDSEDYVHISYYDSTNGDLKYATNTSGDWETLILDDIGDVGQYTSIAIDPQDFIHISYYDVSNGDLKYTTTGFIPGQWFTWSVDKPGDTGKFTSIATDALGNKHISYYDDSVDDLRYATINATYSWDLRTVDGRESTGLATAIAVDTSDNVHIAYTANTLSNIMYATFNPTDLAGSLERYTVHECVDSDELNSVALRALRYNDIVVDSDGNVHISFGIVSVRGAPPFEDRCLTNEPTELSFLNLQIATNPTPLADNWPKESLPNSGYGNAKNSLVIDTEDNLHVIHRDAGAPLLYSTNASESWIAEKVTDKTIYPSFSLAVDSSDWAHIAYYNDDANTGRGLKYITNKQTAVADLAVTISASPDPVTVGEDLTYTMTATNNGPDEATRVILTVTFAGEDLPSLFDFFRTVVSTPPALFQGGCSRFLNTVSCSTNGDLPIGGTVTMEVRFTPTVAGIITSTAAVTSNEVDPNLSNNSASIETTVNPVPQPNIAVTDSVAPIEDLQLPFGVVTLGDSSGQTMTVTNEGTLDLVIGDVAQADPLSAPFGLVNDTCSGQTIDPAGSCMLTVQFDPTSAGDFDDSFDIPSNDPDEGSVTVSVSGTGTATPVPDITITDSVAPIFDLLVPFTNLTEGNTSEEILTITNNGSADLVVGDIGQVDALEAPFSLVNDTCSGQTIAPAGSCTLTVQFAPTSVEDFNDSFDIPSNDPDESTVTVNVSGTGLSSVTNNAPLIPQLVFPTNGQVDLDTTITFVWEESTDPDGDAVTYQFVVCENADFSGCVPEQVVLLIQENVVYAGLGGTGAMLLFMGVGFGFGRPLRTRALMSLGVILLAFGMLVSCGEGGGGGAPITPTGEMSYTVSGLSSSTTYYWKIIVEDGNGAVAESEVRSFTTQ